jgi:hypothetical protein
MLCDMKAMLTLEELEVWCRQTIVGEPSEGFAQAVLDAASLTVATQALHSEWIADDFADPVPARPKLIATLLAKRSFLNPDSIISEGGIGPIGGDRYVEEMAKFLVLTDQEISDLEVFRASGTGAPTGLWTMEIETGRPAYNDDTIYLPDLDDRADTWPVLSTRDFPELGVG